MMAGEPPSRYTVSDAYRQRQGYMGFWKTRQ
jgi:hypothetical protein